MAANMAAKTVNLSNLQGFLSILTGIFFMDNYKTVPDHYTRCKQYFPYFFYKNSKWRPIWWPIWPPKLIINAILSHFKRFNVFLMDIYKIATDYCKKKVKWAKIISYGKEDLDL